MAAIPLRQARLSRVASLAGAWVAVTMGVAWAAYAANSTPGDLGPSYASDEMVYALRVFLVTVGVLGLRRFLARPELRVTPEGLAIVQPVVLRRVLWIPREHVESILFEPDDVRHAVVADPGLGTNMTIMLRARRELSEGRGSLRTRTNRVRLAVGDVGAARAALESWPAHGSAARGARRPAIPERNSAAGRAGTVAIVAAMQALFLAGWVTLGLLLAAALVAAVWADQLRYRRALDDLVPRTA